MAIPDYQSLMRPLLALASDGQEKSIAESVARLSDQFNLTEDERNQILPSGKQTTIANRVHWARTYLTKAGLLAKTRRAHFRITDRGNAMLASYPERIDVSVLRQFPEFVDFQSPKERKTSNNEISEFEPAESATPEEQIAKAETEISKRLRSDLLDRILEGDPGFFERVVVDLIVSMGYGGSRETTAKRIGKSGDEGIDGIVNEDPLGLDIVYLQAKRYAPEHSIGRDKIQQFAGALVGQGANKGVFVTTSSFTQNAIDYAAKIPQRLVLIDGVELTRLMVQYGVGVRTERSVEIKRLDLDYFGEDTL